MICIFQWFNLLRIKHYIKNLLVFIPLFFSKNSTIDGLILTSIGFIAYSLAASAIYIFNDIQDVENDRLHPKKCKRPLSSGIIKISTAFAVGIILAVTSVLISFFINYNCAVIILIYILLNVFYSLKLKNIPLLDVLILAIGYLIRIFYGAYIMDIPISGLLYLTVLTGAIFIGLGKRRGELKKINDMNLSRKVLKYYSYEFLDKNLYVQMALSIVFYSMWCLSFKDSHILLGSIPILIFIFLRYSLLLEGDSDGDPVEIIMSDYAILVFCFIFITLLIVGRYL